jgi:hypothetical protein
MEGRMGDEPREVGPPAEAGVTTASPLREFFRRGITAQDVAEGLVSYDFDQPAAAVRTLMEAHDFDLAGVRVNGVVTGVVQRAGLDHGTCFDHLVELDDRVVVDARAPLAEVIVRLGTSPYVLVRAFGAVGGIVTRADLQKAPVRMWLFGLVTLVEDLLSRTLRQRYPDGTWRDLLSESRLRRAEALQSERRRRNESLELVDCLSFGDKWWILSKDEEVRAAAGWESRAVARERMKEFEQLRNRLAHAQDVATASLATIVRLATHLDRLLRVVGA